MRRITKAGAAAASLTLLLAACSSSGSDTASTDDTPAAGGGSLLIWGDDFTAPVMEELCGEFGDANGVDCEVVQVNDTRADVVAANSTGDVPDIFTGAHDWLGELVTNGVVAPVDLGTKATSFTEAALAGATFNGQNYAVPFAVENVALLTHKALVPECPATLDEVASLADSESKNAKTPGLGMQIGEKGDAYHWFPLYTADGGYVFGENADGSFDTADVGLDSDGGVAAAERLQQLADDKVVSANATYDVALSNFTKGDAPFWITGPWGARDVLAADGFNADDLMVCPIPAWSDGAGPAIPFAGVQQVYQTAKAKNPTVASTFLNDYVMSDAFMDGMYAANPRPPAWIPSAEKVASDPVQAGFIEYGANAYPMPAIAEMATVFEEMGVAEFKVATGDDPAATMKTHADAIRNASGG